MANRFGIPSVVEERLRARDTRCVYCRTRFSRRSRKNWPSIEHLSEEPPFHWSDGLKEDGLGICCTSCNSSRGRKKLHDWFQSPYCRERARPINTLTVAAVVRRYLRSATHGRLTSA